jgi:hypothetical protein
MPRDPEPSQKLGLLASQVTACGYSQPRSSQLSLNQLPLFAEEQAKIKGNYQKD